MAQDLADVKKTRFEALSRGAYLDVLLPKSSDFNASALIQDGSPEELARAPSRRNLFFDEKASIVLVLRTTADTDAVRELLPSLDLVLAAHATDAVPQGSGNAASASGKHDLTSKVLAAVEDVEVLAAGDQTYVIWTTRLDLTRPRTRLQRPAIYFTATLALRADYGADIVTHGKDYLEPFEPLPRNVLESLNSATELRGTQVYLSENRIAKVAPKPVRREETVRPIRGATKRAFPTMPALFTRMKYTTVPGAFIAALTLETSQVITGTISVQHIDVKASGLDAGATDAVAQDNALRGITSDSDTGTKSVQCLTEASLPMHLKAGDESVLLYHLPRTKQSNPSTTTAALDFRLSATVKLEEDSHTELDMSWQSQQEPQQPAPEPSYKWSRPLSNPEPKDVRLSGQALPASIPPSAPAPLSRPSGKGVTFFFTAPETTHQYDDFLLKVQCINHSARSRRFAVMPVRSKHSSLAAHSLSASDDADLVAGIFNAPPLQPPKPDEISCHTPHVKIGPISPGASFDAAIELRAKRTGVLNLGTFKIEDLDTRQTVDVVDLPDIIALEALEGSKLYGPSKFTVRFDSSQLARSKAVARPELDERFWGKMDKPGSRKQ
ncbi:hypothetical protein LTR91_021156 [Friedmanniomyces endolithicus]|uniref:Trafficking protein particle complex II-specific subunit 65 IgD3 domain-containing protein n=2 Tax=Dothideomycetidae TaxID=451867 RepID=A0AAN6HAR4_9PEZI|nr:hypothetical protein LTR94_001525 [Friedmanniomyces endolithicus]KAK5148311.1 hypothetical protein LTR32_000352 [Rachicladosporium monterosium]KAK0774569.1 hypothetical protein LTR38_016169 [Friedmanniomyces endolithicus]KAK0810330.1 hypothetical protein LTR59_002323 [Friedmanniomyces endolithicus]KAK0838764.1 hypothetical protein LTR03_011760 [Friedmanniomyces endolithicus]